MNSADGTIHFNLSFSQNSVYLRVRLRERFVNPQLLNQVQNDSYNSNLSSPSPSRPDNFR